MGGFEGHRGGGERVMIMNALGFGRKVAASWFFFGSLASYRFLFGRDWSFFRRDSFWVREKYFKIISRIGT